VKVTLESIAVMGVLLAIMGYGLFILISQNNEAETSVPATTMPISSVTQPSEGETYQLIIGVENPDLGSVNPKGGTYEKGTTVHLYAHAGSGCMFSRWSGDIVGCQQLRGNELVVPMDSDRCILATFLEDENSLEYKIRKRLEALSRFSKDEINKKIRDAQVEIED